MKKLYNCLLLLCLSLFVLNASAQSLNKIYPKEKIYIQTSHVFFKPGEELYYKLYLVSGENNKPSPMSSIAYVEVFGPAGTVLEKQTLQVKDGYSVGSFFINPSFPGGNYKLRAYTTLMRNETDSTFFTKEFSVQRVISPRILMKLDFQQKGYGPGAAVSADFSMRGLNGQPIRNHTAKFKVSIDGETAETGEFTTDAEGKTKVSFALPGNLKTTDGLLTITVNYDTYTESISRSIPITLDRLDMLFMPEGGSFVGGIQSLVAFKATNEFDKPVDVAGTIVDERGQTIATFNSFKFGMGSFMITPQAGARYTAKITQPASISKTFTLPVAVPGGAVMHFIKKNGVVELSIHASTATEALLTGDTKDRRYYSQKIALKKGDNQFRIDENIFPSGIAQFTLSAGNIPLAERLLFLNEKRKLQVTIRPDQAVYAPREKATLSITTTNEMGKPVPANFSLSVFDDKLWTLADDKQDNIFSWLLLSSELRGHIEEPQFYFKNSEPKAAEALDLVMLTNGYRYFDFIKYVKEKNELRFYPEHGSKLSGIIRGEDGKSVAATVFLINSLHGGEVLKITTSNDGLFYFPSMREYYYLLVAQALKDQKINITILKNGNWDHPDASYIKAHAIEKIGEVIKKPGEGTPVLAERKPEPARYQGIGLGDQQSALEEVVVTGYSTQLKQSTLSSYTIVRNNPDLASALPTGSVGSGLAGRVPGIIVSHQSNPGDEAIIRIRGNGSTGGTSDPLFVVDGVPLDKSDMQSLNVNEIDNITVLKDASATAVYGARAANGVIMIKTKRNQHARLIIPLEKKTFLASQSIYPNHLTFAYARSFLLPIYKTTSTTVRDDFRETIYWNPVVQTDKTGKATVEFYNSDAITTFRAIAEGIGYNGLLGRADTTYATQLLVSTDAKIPPYLTIGDTARIPLTIKNTSNKAIETTIDLTVPKGIQVGPYKTEVTIAANSSQVVFIPINASQTVSGNIKLFVSGRFGQENISLPLSAVNKGFPVINTFSARQSTVHEFTIDKLVPGSITSKLLLFDKLEGQLLDGIESMLREPHGCFEQTSSTTYPNIFVLKYLKESGRLNSEIESKAMRYLKDGYQRLIGFETSEKGFEWFGHAPAQEVLTAYGLLEFTDMLEFIPVDRAMLNRTRELLLKRRDGKGGFIQKSTGGQMHEVPQTALNSYIVYAMSQAGFGADIVPEYQAALKAALKSGDAYLMAMMALAANNMNMPDDYARLMKALASDFGDNRLTAKTSAVNSRGRSLAIETKALYALALMRETKLNLERVTKLISEIVSEKSYYGYGSTQATVLALNALTKFKAITNDFAQQEDIRFTLNGTRVSYKDDLSTLLKEGKNTFSTEYSGGEGVPYSFEVSYQTSIPPTSPKAELLISTTISDQLIRAGETTRMKINVKNAKQNAQPMAVAKIGIPAGLSVQPWQLKELVDKKQAAYYEIFDNYLVLYWMGFAPAETKTINLDLKAEVPGLYQAKASNVYLYYTPEYKHWAAGLDAEVRE